MLGEKAYMLQLSGDSHQTSVGGKNQPAKHLAPQSYAAYSAPDIRKGGKQGEGKAAKVIF